MGFFSNTTGSMISDYFMLLQDVGQLKANNAVNVALYGDHLTLSAPMSKQPVDLNYSKITDVYYGSKTEIVRKNKSVIGRALTGHLLFGDTGAIVGAISGTGQKQKKEVRRVFIISYKSASGEEAFLKFHDTRCYKGEKLAEKLKELCGIKEEIITSL